MLPELEPTTSTNNHKITASKFNLTFYCDW